MRARILKKTILFCAAATVGACGSNPNRVTDVKEGQITPDQLYIVDCLLPAQTRQLGQNFTYLAPRKPAKLTANECALRGGEYVAHDAADFASVAKVWQKQAAAGDANAQNYMGELFERGINGEPDYQAAAQWYQKAADQGLPAALLNLGHLFEAGLGVGKDSVKAINLYRQASGITADSRLELVTEQQMRERREQESERVKLLQEVNRLRHQLSDVNSNYEATKSYIEKANQELHNLQARLKQNNNDVAMQDRIRTLEKQITDLEREKRDSQILANSLVDKIASEQGQQMAYQNNEFGINVISPDVVVTRGIRSVPVLDREASQVSLMGRVNPADQIKALHINSQDMTAQMNDMGVFSAEISLNQDDTPVSIEAMRNDGSKSTERFVIVRQQLERIRARQLSDLFTNRFREDLGNYHALVIGNNNYPNYENLSTAVNDARQVATVLSEKYGYQTRTLINATQMDILKAFSDYQKKLDKYDNLIVYYAGHGVIDSRQNGYWLPVDAKRDDQSTWISNSAITEFMSAMNAKHVMVMADSCYSGTMSGSAIKPLPEQVEENDILFTSRVKARTVLTSGGLQPVLDTGGEGHSIFAAALLDVLNENDGVMEGYRLYRAVSQQVRLRSRLAGLEQAPEYSAIKHAGHEGSEYYFLPERS